MQCHLGNGGEQLEFEELSVSAEAAQHAGLGRRMRTKSVPQSWNTQSAAPEDSVYEGKIAVVGNPLLIMAHQLRGELHQFLHASLTSNRPARLGFEGDEKQAVSSKNLVINIESMCQALEQYFQLGSIGNRDLEFQVGAHNLQTQLEHFLILLVSSAPGGADDVPASRDILSAAVQLKTSLAQIIINADSGRAPRDGGFDPSSAA